MRVSPLNNGTWPPASERRLTNPLHEASGTLLDGEDGLIYFSGVSWSVSTLIDSLDLDISHLGVKIMKTAFKRPVRFMQMVLYLQRSNILGRVSLLFKSINKRKCI